MCVSYSHGQDWILSTNKECCFSGSFYLTRGVISWNVVPTTPTRFRTKHTPAPLVVSETQVAEAVRLRNIILPEKYSIGGPRYRAWSTVVLILSTWPGCDVWGVANPRPQHLPARRFQKKCTPGVVIGPAVGSHALRWPEPSREGAPLVSVYLFN